MIWSSQWAKFFIHQFDFLSLSAATLKAMCGFLLTVLSRLPVVCHHRVRLRFIKGHPSDYHSIGPGLWHLRSLSVSHIFGSHLRFDFNDLSRTICVQNGWIFPNKFLFILILRTDGYTQRLWEKHKPCSVISLFTSITYWEKSCPHQILTLSFEFYLMCLRCISFSQGRK